MKKLKHIKESHNSVINNICEINTQTDLEKFTKHKPSLKKTFLVAGQNYEEKLNKKAVLSQGEPRAVAVNFNTYRILQRHRAVSLPQHGFFYTLATVKNTDREYVIILHSGLQL